MVGRFARRLSGAAFVLALALPAAAQLGPGPLSRAHLEFAGVTKCGSCHNFGAGDRALKCLECHSEIHRRVDSGQGFHAKVYKATPDEADCRRCHKEHKGQSIALVQLDRKVFNHQAQTGFALSGKHARQKCEACHNAAKIPIAARAEIKMKDLNRTFLGLSRDCMSCHKDKHDGQLGTDCQRCHDQNAFKPAPGFNHSTARFTLTGLHQNTPCVKCHGPKEEGEAPRYKGLTFAACQNCHNDPHHGAFQDAQFRGTCENCHNTGGWKTNQPASSFNHSGAKYKLEGKHAALACAKCHKTADFNIPIAHARCRDCHEDSHKNQFAARAAGSDCSACHTLAGYKPAKFDREAHRQSGFPLEGKHAALDCVKCHQPPGKDAVYITRKLLCSACHADFHGGQFAAAPHLNRCEQCHNAAGFKPSTLTAERHAQTRFPLLGKHASVACEKCHKPLAVQPADPGGSFGPSRQFAFPSLACNSCHEDPHRSRKACEDCHTADQWQTVRSFDHSTAKFKLEGAHRDRKCVECHDPKRPGVAAPVAGSVAAKPAPLFGDTPAGCVGCHAAKDAHGGQFHAGAPEFDCSRCHDPARWKLDPYDHDRAAFVLNRAHINVACDKCHKEQKVAGGKLFRVYRGTPAECIQCHLN